MLEQLICMQHQGLLEEAEMEEVGNLAAREVKTVAVRLVAVKVVARVEAKADVMVKVVVVAMEEAAMVAAVVGMAAEGMVAAKVGRGSKEDQAEVMAVVEQEERKEGTEVAVARLAEQ